jgi:hypothetical protein
MKGRGIAVCIATMRIWYLYNNTHLKNIDMRHWAAFRESSSHHRFDCDVSFSAYWTDINVHLAPLLSSLEREVAAKD